MKWWMSVKKVSIDCKTISIQNLYISSSIQRKHYENFEWMILPTEQRKFEYTQTEYTEQFMQKYHWRV